MECRSGFTGQNHAKLGTLTKQDDRNSKISNILLRWQHSRFEPWLIRNTIRAIMGFLAVVLDSDKKCLNCMRFR